VIYTAIKSLGQDGGNNR